MAAEFWFVVAEPAPAIRLRTDAGTVIVHATLRAEPGRYRIAPMPKPLCRGKADLTDATARVRNVRRVAIMATMVAAIIFLDDDLRGTVPLLGIWVPRAIGALPWRGWLLIAIKVTIIGSGDAARILTGIALTHKGILLGGKNAQPLRRGTAVRRFPLQGEPTVQQPELIMLANELLRAPQRPRAGEI